MGLSCIVGLQIGMLHACIPRNSDALLVHLSFCTGIASGCLNQSDLKQVYKVVFEARAKWRLIGLQLELTHGDLEAINLHYRNPDDQLERVLAKWLRGGEATWRQLMEALYSVSVRETALAEQIRMKHCQQGRLNDVIIFVLFKFLIYRCA